MIQYSIESALKTNLFDKVMVSTDDVEIARVSTRLRADVPFLRPGNLAEDETPMIDVVSHVLISYRALRMEFEAVCLLQPTSPIRTIEGIRKCLSKFTESNSDSLISVRKVPLNYNPHWTFELAKDPNYLQLATNDKKIISRRQDLPIAYHRDGSVYIVKTSTVLEDGDLYGEKISFVDFTDQLHVNIDTLEDWSNAERIISNVRDSRDYNK